MLNRRFEGGQSGARDWPSILAGAGRCVSIRILLLFFFVYFLRLYWAIDFFSSMVDSWWSAAHYDQSDRSLFDVESRLVLACANIL